MTQPTAPRRPAGPPSIDELMGRFLAARSAGMVGDLSASGEVEPHEVTGGFRPTATSTWTEAQAVFRLFGIEPEKVALPPEWATFSALALPVAAVPLAAGLFPQRVRAIPTSIGQTSETESVTGLSGLRSWVQKALASKSPTMLLLAAGIAAGLGDWTEAEAALSAAEPLCDGAWHAVWLNQKAAVQWLRGDITAAAKTWSAAGNDEPTTLNKGMAELFSQKTGHGSRSLQDVASRLPDDSGWSHLANLYLSLARAQG